MSATDPFAGLLTDRPALYRALHAARAVAAEMPESDLYGRMLAAYLILLAHAWHAAGNARGFHLFLSLLHKRLESWGRQRATFRIPRPRDAAPWLISFAERLIAAAPPRGPSAGAVAVGVLLPFDRTGGAVISP